MEHGAGADGDGGDFIGDAFNRVHRRGRAQGHLDHPQAAGQQGAGEVHGGSRIVHRHHRDHRPVGQNVVYCRARHGLRSLSLSFGSGYAAPAKVTDHFARRVAPGQAADAAARMGARTTEIEALDRHAIGAVAEQRTGREQLVGG